MIRADMPPNRDRGVRLGQKSLSAVLASFSLLLIALITACTTVDDGRGPATVSAEEAAAFGGVTLPAGAEVLATSTDGAIDTRYRLALRMTAAQADELMTKSDFSEPVIPSDRGREATVLAGPALSSATDLRYGQDRIETDHGTVTREVIEDHRSPEEVYVHLSMFTT